MSIKTKYRIIVVGEGTRSVHYKAEARHGPEYSSRFWSVVNNSLPRDSEQEALEDIKADKTRVVWPVPWYVKLYRRFNL